MRLAGKTAIVTGGASGFGAGIVRAFLAEGAKVMIADLDGRAGESLAASCRTAGQEVVSHELDVTRGNQVTAAVTACVSAFGGLDIMVANAGIGQRPCPLEETEEAEFDRQLQVNVKGVFHCAKAAIPQFRRQGKGNIIITASGIALKPRPNLVAYGAAKGAVLALAKGLALELAGAGIRVNALCPAVGDTPMLAEFMGGEETAEARESFVAGLPIGRLITPEDVGAAALFLAADAEAGAITGSALAVDGGRCV